MPPIHTKNARDSIEIERRLELTISAIKKQEILSISKAACIFNVSCTTLDYWLKEWSSRANLHANHHKLTETEENLLV